MSREIKFKAWDKVRKVMYDVDTIEMDILKDGSSDNQISGWDDTEWQCGIPLEDVELLQYTGIKDYEGKEIYEGDIVEKEIMESLFDDSKLIGVVEMIEGCWCVVNDKKKVAKNLWSETDVNRVIGNVYENKELLEVE